MGSDGVEQDFCVDGSRPYFQDQLSDINCSEQYNYIASKFEHSDYVEAVEVCGTEAKGKLITREGVEIKTLYDCPDEQTDELMKLEDGEYIEDE